MLLKNEYFFVLYSTHLHKLVLSLVILQPIIYTLFSFIIKSDLDSNIMGTFLAS